MRMRCNTSVERLPGLGDDIRHFCGNGLGMRAVEPGAFGAENTDRDVDAGSFRLGGHDPVDGGVCEDRAGGGVSFVLRLPGGPANRMP